MDYTSEHIDVLRDALRKEWLKVTGEWPAYDMVKAIFGEESTLEKGIYQRLVTEKGRFFVDGSLAELEIIRRKFEWSQNIKVFAILDRWRVLGDRKVPSNKVPRGDPIEMEVYIQTLQGHWFQIDEEERASLLPRIKGKSKRRSLKPKTAKENKGGSLMPREQARTVVRGLKPFIKDQIKIMNGIKHPWDRTDNLWRFLSPDQFIQRYFFEGMKWYEVERDARGQPLTGCTVEKSYFNLFTKSVFLLFALPSPPEE